MARSRRKDGHVSMDIRQLDPGPPRAANTAPRRARAARRDAAVIQAEIRRLALAQRRTGTGRRNTPTRNADNDLYPAA